MRQFHVNAFFAASLLASSVTAKEVKHMPNKIDGRLDKDYPSPRHHCKPFVDECVPKDSKRHAFLTTVRTSEYLPLLHELQCSLHEHEPTAHLIVAAVAGDLPVEAIDEIKSRAEYMEFEDVVYKNELHPRFGKNWVKLRAWGLEQYDSLIMLDADAVVTGSLSHLFNLPTDFAITEFQGPNWKHNSGGLVFLRPCNAVLEHMLHLLDTNPEMRFTEGLAEQSFLNWYFRYTAVKLPMSYNANFEWLLKTGEKTAGGDEPLFVHFVDEKPFKIGKDSPEAKFLCTHRKANAGASKSGS